MSFAVKHAVKKEISGSFRLLSQSAGRTQHAPATPAAASSAAAAPSAAPAGAAASGPGAVRDRRSDCSSVEEVLSVSESDAASTPVHAMERRKTCAKKKVARPSPAAAAAAAAPAAAASNEDSSFLRHLELEPGDAPLGRGGGPAFSTKGGRTPFTTTRRLTRHAGGGFGFSVAWTQPPRVERVEAGLSADRAGLRPGDYIIFVEKYNVVTVPEDEVLQLIRSCGNTLTLEVYRRGPPNGLVSGGGGGGGGVHAPGGAASAAAGAGAAGGSAASAVASSHLAMVGALAAAAGAPAAAAASAGASVPVPAPVLASVCAAAAAPSPAPPPRSSTTCSATTTSLDLSKRRLHLPQVTFSSEVGSGVIV